MTKTQIDPEDRHSGKTQGPSIHPSRSLSLSLSLSLSFPVSLFRSMVYVCVEVHLHSCAEARLLDFDRARAWSDPEKVHRVSTRAFALALALLSTEWASVWASWGLQNGCLQQSHPIQL